jgi:hypothetical protein
MHDDNHREIAAAVRQAGRDFPNSTGFGGVVLGESAGNVVVTVTNLKLGGAMSTPIEMRVYCVDKQSMIATMCALEIE